MTSITLAGVSAEPAAEAAMANIPGLGAVGAAAAFPGPDVASEYGRYHQCQMLRALVGSLECRYGSHQLLSSEQELFCLLPLPCLGSHGNLQQQILLLSEAVYQLWISDTFHIFKQGLTPTPKGSPVGSRGHPQNPCRGLCLRLPPKEAQYTHFGGPFAC